MPCKSFLKIFALLSLSSCSWLGGSHTLVDCADNKAGTSLKVTYDKSKKSFQVEGEVNHKKDRSTEKKKLSESFPLYEFKTGQVHAGSVAWDTTNCAQFFLPSIDPKDPVLVRCLGSRLNEDRAIKTLSNKGGTPNQKDLLWAYNALERIKTECEPIQSKIYGYSIIFPSQKDLKCAHVSAKPVSIPSLWPAPDIRYESVMVEKGDGGEASCSFDQETIYSLATK